MQATSKQIRYFITIIAIIIIIIFIIVFIVVVIFVIIIIDFSFFFFPMTGRNILFLGQISLIIILLIETYLMKKEMRL